VADDVQLDDHDAPLPGLELQLRAGASKLEEEVARSFQRMQRDGLIDDRHAGLLELGKLLARRIGSGSYGKDYGVAQLSAQLLGVFDKLMPDEEGGGSSDGFDRWQQALSELDQGGSAAPVGHPG
jgi:hypothetical protein